MPGAVAKANGVQLRLCPLKRVGMACQLQRGGDVFQGCHRRDQVEGLKHNAHVIAPKACKRILIHPGQVAPQGADRAARGPLQPAHQHQEGGLARPGRSDQAQRLTARHIQRDAMQNIHTARIAIQRQSGIFKGKNRIGHGASAQERGVLSIWRLYGHAQALDFDAFAFLRQCRAGRDCDNCRAG